MGVSYVGIRANGVLEFLISVIFFIYVMSAAIAVPDGLIASCYYLYDVMLFISSCDRVTIDGVWIGNSIY
jgi:hypothetical protein